MTTEKGKPKRDWIDIGTFIVLVLAFLAAAAAAVESYRLANLTQTAIEHADKAGTDQHNDTVAALGKADDANRIAKESSGKQLREMTAARRAAEAAASIAKTQTDAFIAAESAVLILPEDGGVQLIRGSTIEAENGRVTSGEVPEFSTLALVIKNVGRNAATIVRLDLRWDIQPGPPAGTLADAHSYPLNITLAAGDEATVNLFTYPIELTGMQLASMRHGAHLWVRCTITYLDILRKPVKGTFLVYWDTQHGFRS